jgi:chromosome segregation ATPase
MGRREALIKQYTQDREELVKRAEPLEKELAEIHAEIQEIDEILRQLDPAAVKDIPQVPRLVELPKTNGKPPMTPYQAIIMAFDRHPDGLQVADVYRVIRTELGQNLNEIQLENTLYALVKCGQLLSDGRIITPK